MVQASISLLGSTTIIWILLNARWGDVLALLFGYEGSDGKTRGTQCSTLLEIRKSGLFLDYCVHLSEDSDLCGTPERSMWTPLGNLQRHSMLSSGIQRSLQSRCEQVWVMLYFCFAFAPVLCTTPVADMEKFESPKNRLRKNERTNEEVGIRGQWPLIVDMSKTWNTWWPVNKCPPLAL